MTENITLNILKKTDDAMIPIYGSKYAVGMDIFSNTNDIISAGKRKLISTGISVSWSGLDEENYYLRVAPRSGLSVKNNIDIGAGVIDYDYRGIIYVCMINNGTNDFEVVKGMKIAQLILEKCNRPIIKEVSDLDNTERGNNGFGSTGI
jgi:dUTP pyrophosphatase